MIGGIASLKLVDQLSAWFHRRDRSVFLAEDCYAFLPWATGINNYLAVAFITETILTASAASVTFSSLPIGYRSLMFKCWARSDSGTEVDYLFMRFNGDSGAGHYDYAFIWNAGSAVSTSQQRAQNGMWMLLMPGANARANNYSAVTIHVDQYQSSYEKWAYSSIGGTFGDLSADADLLLGIFAGRWRNRNVITSVSFLPAAGPNFVAGSRFQAYGVL